MKGARVLVVDDEPDVRGLLSELLARGGYEVREAADGRAGLRELFAAPADVVILDVAMPGLDGFATLERIRDVSDVPVLMLTAHGNELTPLEFKLLAAFVAHPNQVLSREQTPRARVGGSVPGVGRPGEAVRGVPPAQAGVRARADRDGARLRLPLPATQRLSLPDVAGRHGRAAGRPSPRRCISPQARRRRAMSPKASSRQTSVSCR